MTRVADKRGPARVAATLYEETPESAVVREQRRVEHRLSRPREPARRSPNEA